MEPVIEKWAIEKAIELVNALFYVPAGCGDVPSDVVGVEGDERVIKIALALQDVAKERDAKIAEALKVLKEPDLSCNNSMARICLAISLLERTSS